MKKLFAEYYALPEDRINEIWANSLIVFDTNVLLNLYRYNEDARKEFIKVIEFYEERLWIPYQVGLEFHRRREDILRKNAAAYQKLGDDISEGLLKVIDTLNSQRDYARHPYINMKDIRSKVERCATSIAKSLKKQEENHPDNFEQDEILDAITQLFDGRVGHDFSEEELATIYQEGEHRFANKVPPGYCDEKNKKDKPKRHLYGDLIVWKQTISHSAEQKKDIIFITDDHKTDWWDKVEGKHTPRKELIKEFAESTGQCVLIYDSSRFLEYAKNNKVKVSQKTIKEVEKVKKSDWSYLDLLSQVGANNPLYGNVHRDLYHAMAKSQAAFSNYDWLKSPVSPLSTPLSEYVDQLKAYRESEDVLTRVMEPYRMGQNSIWGHTRDDVEWVKDLNKAK